MNIILKIIGIIIFLILIVAYIIIESADININEIKLTYPKIISIFTNVIGLILLFYSIIANNNYINRPSIAFLDRIFYAYMFLFYITFLVTTGFILFKNKINENKNYLILNSIFLILIIPLIIYRNDINFSEDVNINNIDKDDFVNTTIEKGGGLDLVEYDNKGNKKVITDKNKIEIRKNAARSEYDERSNIESGIYD